MELDGSERPGKRLHLVNGRAAVANDRGKKPIAPHLVSGDRKISIGNHKKDLVIPKTEEGTDTISSSFERAVPVRRPGTSFLPTV